MQDQDDIYTDRKQDEPVIPTAQEIRAVYNKKLDYIPPVAYEPKIHYIRIDETTCGIFPNKNIAYGILNAINNTYASGIDPEHISEALQCLIALRNMCLSTRNGQTIFLTEESYNQLKNVIDKIFIK